jgi:hypothetical protein
MGNHYSYHHHSSSVEKSKCRRRSCKEEAHALDLHLKARPHLMQLREAVEAWVRHRLLGDEYLIWRTPDYWAELHFDPEMHDGADLILIFEELGSLVDILNYEIEDWAYAELSELAGKYGYGWELGHSWNIGFFKEENDSVIPDASEFGTGLSFRIQ